jgi:hypothetical protein
MMRCLAALSLTLATSLTYADIGCRHEAERSAQADTTGVRKIVLGAGAGDLKVRGERTNKVSATGRACASSDELLQQIQLISRREGDTLYLSTQLPESDGDFLVNRYARMDLSVSLPNSIALEINDSSGDTEIAQIAAARIADGSGDLDIENVAGDLQVTDSSGDLDIKQVTGNLKMTDSSGDVDIEHVQGAVDVEVDSSGDMRMADVGSVHIRNDSSGEIVIERVARGVQIDADSSGDISVENVGGDFTVAADSSGSISHNHVTGRVQIPRS